MKYKKTGFTLLELMVTVAIIAVLASIAIPSYQQYILKGRRADGKSAILDVQLAEEKWRTNNITYTSSIVADLGLSATSKENYYDMSISGNTGTNYKITATHKGVQVADTKCKTLSIDQDGTKTSTDTANAVSTGCWD